MLKVRRAFTLLEVVVALAITGSLLFFVFLFFKQLAVENIEMEKVKERVFVSQRMQARLKQVFGEVKGKKGEEELFFTEPGKESRGPALFFTFNNGADREETLCGWVKGSLYLSLKHELILCTTPLEDAGAQNEVLANQVDSFSLEFFDPIKKVWENSWERKKGGRPAMLRIKLKQKGEEDGCSFAFFFPEANNPISYP